ncbi:MAG: hypothetical protein JZD40_01750 [Sulfolobus sp.]|nr:hypothetical protein [Sulfolobus sp.]
MPTIHLSLPEWLYDELKQKAEELGVQITDLVKFYIKKGLELEESVTDESTEKDKVESNKYEEEIALLNAKVAQLDTLMLEVLRKLKILEEEEEDNKEEVEIVKNEK